MISRKADNSANSANRSALLSARQLTECKVSSLALQKCGWQQKKACGAVWRNTIGQSSMKRVIREPGDSDQRSILNEGEREDMKSFDLT